MKNMRAKKKNIFFTLRTIILNLTYNIGKMINLNKNTLSILCFHSISNNADRYSIDRDTFTKVIAKIAQITQQPLINIKPVVIEEGAWIGAHVTVVSGVTIGKNSVVGANSVVTNNIPNYRLAAGVPAKVIKKFNLKKKNWEKV